MSSRPHPYQGCALPLSYRGIRPRRAPIVASGANVKRCLKERPNSGKAFHMSEGTGNKMSREERLAAKLRENLRRRKAQGREMQGDVKRESRKNAGDKELSKDGSES